MRESQAKTLLSGEGAAGYAAAISSVAQSVADAKSHDPSVVRDAIRGAELERRLTVQQLSQLNEVVTVRTEEDVDALQLLLHRLTGHR